jgi:type I restriction enzyme, R subunit
MATSEAKARIKINKLLEDAGWRLLDDENGSANVVLEQNTKITLELFENLGDNFENTKDGFTDYTLLDEKKFPLAVLEAKKEEINPLSAKEKTRAYARGLNARFVILSNGNIHYLWDLKAGSPEQITRFPSQESLSQRTKFKPEPSKLVAERVGNDYILLTQKPDYASDPGWIDEASRAEYLENNELRLLREYQLDAIRSVQDAVRERKTRFLFEMATGTGKTLVSAAVIKLFLRSGNAQRVLFLVDRLELEQQAKKDFTKYLVPDYTTVVYKENRSDWHKAEIVITTVQSLLVGDKYQRLFNPTDFDLVISDEAHRSIGGNARAVFEYFIGYKLGLTATPKDYLKGVDEADYNDPRNMERRLLLDTYKTFGCESGNPTFRYSLLEGVREGFLINPITIDARTEITTQLLSDEGYSVIITGEDGQDEETIYTHRDFERKFLSEETNKIFVNTFIENALKDPISGEIGKTLAFCVSQNHAAKITNLLNLAADKLWPGKYNSDFAVQVTSRVTDAQQYTRNFANNNLLGHTRRLDNYKSSRARVCVTVGMMTTGYDCTDILNLCLIRPIFSPQDFVQIKGRGTRRHIFKYTAIDEYGEKQYIQKHKEHFKMFDFFGNCEYFEETYDYDQRIELPTGGGESGGGGGEGPVQQGEYENFDPDPLKSLDEKAIGLNGMRVDRELYGEWENQVENDPVIKEKVMDGDMNSAVDYLMREYMNKPEAWMTPEKIRKAHRVDRRISLREFLEVLFGKLPRFERKQDILDREFGKFVDIYKVSPENALAARNVLQAYITDSKVREIIDSRHYGVLNTTQIAGDFRELPQELRKVIPNYVKDYVPLNRFM